MISIQYLFTDTIKVKTKTHEDMEVQVDNEVELDPNALKAHRPSVVLLEQALINYRNQQQCERSQEQKLARISCLIVWLFLFCHIWKLVPTAFETFSPNAIFHKDWPSWVLMAEGISHLLITLNSTINFLIYIFA